MLQDDWWIWVLRPNSVSFGSTLIQLDFTPQSPQPSQTRSLMNIRLVGSLARPRFRARRNSAAHSWSCSSTVVPGVAANARCASSRRSRCQISVAPDRTTFSYLPGSSVVTMIFLTPFASKSETMFATGWAPVIFCPPVIEVCALYSSLNVIFTSVAAQ